ncbi:MAG: hypothetical protein QOD69_465, partial [Solirubrobacteraceae bacterium]|nr:hypothetical protein [Solirubrobacteraceae bacterium]
MRSFGRSSARVRRLRATFVAAALVGLLLAGVAYGACPRQPGAARSTAPSVLIVMDA